MKSRIRRFGVGSGRLSIFRTSVVAALITVAALSACMGTTEPVAAVSIVPASQTVALQSSPEGPTLNTSVTLTNTSATTVYWHSCALTLEQNVWAKALTIKGDDAWQLVWSQPICALAIYSLSALAPGESVTVPVSAVTTRAYSPSFTGDPGLYRFHFFLSMKVEGEFRPLPYEATSSDPFTLVSQ